MACPEVHAELYTSVTVPRQRDRATLLCEGEGPSGCCKDCEVISMASSFDTRHLVRLRVQLNGVDCAGHRFKQTAFTHDVSMRGARLEDVPLLVEPAAVVEVRHRGKRGRFRVVWVGGLGRNEVGLESLEYSKCIWGSPLPGKPIRTTPPSDAGRRTELPRQFRSAFDSDYGDPWGNAQ